MVPSGSVPLPVMVVEFAGSVIDLSLPAFATGAAFEDVSTLI
jgi:hypothetical protein